MLGNEVRRAFFLSRKSAVAVPRNSDRLGAASVTGLGGGFMCGEC